MREIRLAPAANQGEGDPTITILLPNVLNGDHLDGVYEVLLAHLENREHPDHSVGEDAHHLGAFGGGHLGSLEDILLLEHHARCHFAYHSPLVP